MCVCVCPQTLYQMDSLEKGPTGGGCDFWNSAKVSLTRLTDYAQ